MARKTVKDILEKEMPDVELVETPSKTSDSLQRATRAGPSMAELRKKYLGDEAEEGQGANAGEPSTEDEGDIEVKQVRTKATSADPADDPGTRGDGTLHWISVSVSIA